LRLAASADKVQRILAAGCRESRDLGTDGSASQEVRSMKSSITFSGRVGFLSRGLPLSVALLSVTGLPARSFADDEEAYPSMVALMQNTGSGWDLSAIVLNDPNNFSTSHSLATSETEWDPSLPVSSDPDAWNLITVFEIEEMIDLANGDSLPTGITADNLTLDMQGGDGNVTEELRARS
jgi:hypothetical protein